MSKKSFITSLGIIVFILLLAVIYQTSMDTRKSIYDYTKWGADSLGLLVGYTGLFIGSELFLLSGGKMRKGLLWFDIGMFIMGSSFFFGPILNHYHLIKPDMVEAFHGIGMLGGMIGYVIAFGQFTSIAVMDRPRRYYAEIAVGALFMLLFIPTMLATRTLGNVIKYWTELAGFGLGGAMIPMAIYALKHVGGAYRRALTWLFVSAIAMVASYPFGPISQPNPLWTGPQGGTFHHGIMAIAISLFLVTAVLLSRLQIYGQDHESQT